MNLAFTAMQIAQILAAENILFITDDEQQAEALTAAVRCLRPENPIFHVASSDALPGDPVPASPANAGMRVAALRALRLAQQDEERLPIACIVSGEAAARRYATPLSFDSAPPTVRVGDSIDIPSFQTALIELGYFGDDRVDEPGEMAIRGDVIDLFPADAQLPARIDIIDGRVNAVRAYDPITQRTVAEIQALEIGRAAEPPIEEAVTILAHLTPGVLAGSSKADQRRQRFIQLATDAVARSGKAIDAMDEEAWSCATKLWRYMSFEDDIQPVPRFAQAASPLAALVRFAKPLLAEGRALLLAGSRRDLRFLRARVSKRLALDLAEISDWTNIEGLKASSGASITMPIDAGFIDDRLIVIAAADLIGSRALMDDAPVKTANSWASRGAEVRVGDIVVHEDHGVARVLGLEPDPGQGDVGDGGEMIALEYADDARRLVATYEADRIWRYGADADAVTLDRLDGASWLKRRSTIDIAIAESAKGLAALAEARAKLTAPAMVPDPAAYERFASGFAFSETADQARAIAAVRNDLATGKPMDRLIVGDVGYGKTEVALRAAAIAALAGYQTVIAAPTTVLVRQHIETFCQRFEDLGIKVAGLSRLTSPAEKKAIKAGLADGSVQVVIGTGAVMAKGVSFAKLGLVIVDEEQRFGAADKAKLRSSGDVHLLTLSATPIPRTLQMALIGLQQISIIATPPARRQPIRTSLDHYDDGRIRTALLREKGRGGQSFVVVPRIVDMAILSEKLRRVAPDLVLVEAHGKMSAADIDTVMVGFGHGHGDILLATNIIEAGLDVPRANTMIVWRADRFGLAQLHQLRGRVGRGNRRGQVILLTQSEEAIGERTLKRLRTLATFDRLGAGFDISAQDLDMRGAGDLLGENQAGHIKLIGIDLYQHLLGTALRQARGEDVERWKPDLHLGSGGGLPQVWIPEADVRLALYVRLSRIIDDDTMDAFEDELIDRFGPLPQDTVMLLTRARIRIAARRLSIARIDAGPAAIALTLRRGHTSDLKASGLVEKNGRLLLLQPTQYGDPISCVQTLLYEVALTT